MFRQKLLLIFFTCAITLIPGCSLHASSSPDNAQSYTSSQGTSAANSGGEPGVALFRREDGSTGIEAERNVTAMLRSNELFFSGDSRVLKIGTVYTKGKSIDELTKLLAGPVDSTVEVTLTQGDQFNTKLLKRYSLEKLYKESEDYGQLLNLSNLITGNASNQDLLSGGESNHARGNDFVAAPYFISLAASPKFRIPPLIDQSSIGLSEALEFFARTGLFDQFDAESSRVVQISETNALSDTDVESLTKCSAILAQKGYPNKARTIYDNLHRKLDNLSEQNKIRVMLGRASVVNHRDETSTAESYKKIASACAALGNTPREFLLSSLQDLVSQCTKNKIYDVATIAQLQIVSLNQNSEGFVRQLQFQNRVAALVGLSEIYELAGYSTKAQNALQQALSIYDEGLNAQELMLLERLGVQCRSDVLLRLANSYARSKEFDKASAQLALVEKAISEALGAENQTSIKVAKIKNDLLAQKNQPKREQVLSEFDNLREHQNQNNALTDSRAKHLRIARQSYDEILAKHNSKAISLVDKLLQRELSKSTHTAADTVQLINLARYLARSGARDEARTVLTKLDTCFEKPGASLSTNRVYELAERALLTDDDSTRSSASSETSWAKLETLLRDMDVAQFNRGSRNEVDGTERSLDRLLSVSYAYAIFDEPQKALRIEQYAVNKYPLVLERNVSPIAYEAILYLLKGNMAKAQKQIDTLLAPTKGYHYDYSRMLIALTSTLANTGHSDLSLKLLDPNLAGGRHSKQSLEYQRALIEYRLGKYQESLAALGADENPALPVDNVFNYRYLRADLLAKTGRTNEAIVAYLKVANNGPAQAQAFDQAVLLSRKLSTLPASTVQALVDAVLHQQGGTPDKQNVETIKYVIRLANEHKIPTNSLDELSNRLSYAQSMNPNVDEAIVSTRKHAQTLEDEHKPGANYEWANVARMYFAHKQYAEGTAAMLHALQITTAGSSFNNGMYHPGNLRGDIGFDLLVKAKRYDDAEKILRQCIETHKLASDFSKTAYIEKYLLAELFIEEGRFDEAEKWADALLNTFSADNAMCDSNGEVMRAFIFYTIVDKFTEAKQYTIAQTLLEQATKIQLAEVGPRNGLFIENYQSKAKLMEAQNKLPAAEDFARKALEVETWVGGSRNTGFISRGLLASILRKEGKNAEADQVSVTPTMTENRQHDLQALYNIRMEHSHMTLPEHYADTAEAPLKSNLAEAIKIHGEGSTNAIEASENLSKFYVQQHKYDQAERQELYELKILDEKFGKCAKPKASCYLLLAELYVKKNRIQEALKFVQKITEPPEAFPGIIKPLASLRLAHVLFAVGKRDQALELGRKIEKNLLANPRRGGWGWDGASYDQQLNECLHFMETVGAASDVVILREEVTELEKQRHSNRSRQF